MTDKPAATENIPGNAGQISAIASATAQIHIWENAVFYRGLAAGGIGKLVKPRR